MGFITFLIVGALAGWLAGKIMKGRGFGVLGNIFVGIVGSMIGGYGFSLLGISGSGFLGSTVIVTGGAVLLLFVVGKLK